MLPAPPSCSGDCRGRLVTFDPDTPAVLFSASIPAGRSLGTEALDAGGEYATPDGALVVWLEPREVSPVLTQSQLGLFDVRRRTATTLPLFDAATIVGHPRRTEIFLNDGAGPLALSLAGARRFAGPSCAGPSSQPHRVSHDGRRVLFSCGRSPRFGQIFVLDTDTGATVDTRMSEFVVPALSRDGSEIYTVEAGLLRRYALGGSSPLAEVAVPATIGSLPETIESMQVEPRTGRVFLFGAGIHSFDGTTLQPVRAAGAPWSSLPNGALVSWTFDPALPRAYVTSRRTEPPATQVHTYRVIDTEQFVVSLSQDLLPGPSGAGAGRFLVAPRPAAPVGMAATVQGSTVQLSWAAGASNATTLRYLVEAGTAPGLANIATFDVGPQTSLTAGGVPPGTYYVRVRADNVTGDSAPSNEVVVVVP
jgi:hypothetical protein